MFRAIRSLPWFRVLAVAQTALLARQHLRVLTPVERRRLMELVRRANRLSPAERDEVRWLVAKLEPRAFMATTASRFAPVPVPRRFFSGRTAR